MLSAVVVLLPSSVEPLYMIRVIVELGSAVPVSVGVLSLASVVIVKEEGASGPVVSMVMESEEDFEETLPAASVAVAFIEYVPSSKAVVMVIEKLPLLSAVPVPKSVFPL